MNLYQWLVRAVKLDGTKARRNLFLKLDRLVRAYGDPVKRTILEVWEESATHCNDAPRDHYFAKSVKLRLIDRELWHETRPFDHLAGAELDAMFKDEGPLPLFDHGTSSNGKPAPSLPPMDRAEFVRTMTERLARNTEP